MRRLRRLLRFDDCIKGMRKSNGVGLKGLSLFLVRSFIDGVVYRVRNGGERF